MLRGLDVVAPLPAGTGSYGHGPAEAHAVDQETFHTRVPAYSVGALTLAVAFGLLDVYQTYLAFQLVPGFYEMNFLSPFQDQINQGEFGGALALKILALASLAGGTLWIHRAYPVGSWIHRVNRTFVFGWASLQALVVMFGIYSLFQYASSITPAWI